MQILSHVLDSAQPSDYIKQCIIYRPLHNRPNKLPYDVTFVHRYLHDKKMTICKQIRVHAVVVDCFTVQGLCRI